MAHKVADFGEFKDKVTVEHEDGTVFHIEKEKFLLIETIAKKVFTEAYDGRRKEREGRIQAICSGNTATGKREPNSNRKSGVRKVDSEDGNSVS